MAKNTTSKLDALLAADAAPSLNQIAQNGTTVPDAVVKNAVKTAPADKKNGAVKTVAPDQIKVKRGTVSTGPIDVPGFALAFSEGTLDASVKATVQRATTNPWYEVVSYLNARPAGYITITRTDSTEKSPVSKIKTARNRAIDAGLKNAGKMLVKSSADDKNVWYLVRQP